STQQRTSEARSGRVPAISTIPTRGCPACFSRSMSRKPTACRQRSTSNVVVITEARPQPTGALPTTRPPARTRSTARLPVSLTPLGGGCLVGAGGGGDELDDRIQGYRG